MSDLTQYILVSLIVAAAVVAAVRAVVHAAKSRKTVLTACTGCKLRDVCQNAGKKSAKKCADKVAQVEK